MNRNDLDLLIKAYNEISVLNVSGDAVEVMASARSKIRTVIEKLGKDLDDKSPKEEVKNEGNI